MKKLLYLTLLIFICIGCFLFGFSKTNITKTKKVVITKSTIKPVNQTIIYIQPLGDVKSDYLKSIKEGVKSFYHFECVVKPSLPLTNDLLVKSKLRYSADKILSKFNYKENYLILTEKDIATPKNGYPEWGVFGLGYRPGSVCVVSTFRLKRNVTENVIKDRIKKVALHEIGHNLGLSHCDYNRECLMNDARGTITQVDTEKKWLCNRCKEIIKK